MYVTTLTIVMTFLRPIRLVLKMACQVSPLERRKINCERVDDVADPPQALRNPTIVDRHGFGKRLGERALELSEKDGRGTDSDPKGFPCDKMTVIGD
jgi:hypothetical protein